MELLPAINPTLDTVHCCRAEDFLTALPAGYVDLIVTSPPYDNLRTYNGFSWDFQYIARQSYRVLKPGGVLVWVVGDATINGSETLTSMRQALYFVDSVGFRMHQTIIWKKSSLPGIYGKRCEPVFEYMFVCSKGDPKTWNPPMEKSKYAGSKVRNGSRSGGGWEKSDGHHVVKAFKVISNVWEIDKGLGRTSTDGTTEHPAMFPEALAERHILTWSNPGDIVLDFFGGSGTTAKMARKNNRHWLYCDISEQYAEIARKRLAQPYTPNMFEKLAS